MTNRVLIVEASGNLWGSERALLDLVDRLPDADVAVCCPPGKPLLAELERMGVRTLPYYVDALHEKSVWQRLRAAIGVLRACVEFRPDVLYLNQSGCYKVATPAAALLDLPIIAHVRLFEDAAYLARQRPSRRRLHGVIAISRAIEAELRSFPQLEAIPVHRIYDAFAAGPAAAGVKRASDRIACVGRLEAIKGHDILVRAVQIMSPSMPELTCVMAGSGEAEGSLKQISGDDVGIEWLGVVGDVASLLRGCAVLACPSHREPLGRVIFEAWEAGVVPVVFAGSGGAAEVVAAADGGILYEPQTPEALAAALVAALALPKKAATQFVEHGRAWMTAHCDPEAYGRTLATIFAQAAADRRSPR